ncbi:ribonuclease J [archaeon]|nr:ribonuclease J [archaeon]
MPIEICTIGGFSECGRNCTAIRVDDEVVILDLGLEMESYIRHTQQDRDNVVKLDAEDLIKVNAVPNLHLISDWMPMVKAIIPSHGHLDHIGAIPFLAVKFPHIPIISTPYTIEVISSILKEERLQLSNELIVKKAGQKYKVSDKITVEFVHVTHSIPHTAMLVVETPYGRVVYANDYKLDMTPTLGKKPDLKRIKELGNEGVDLLICESLYAGEHRKTPSEAVAKQMLKDILNRECSDGHGLVVTTFASQIARIKSIIELGGKLNRKIVFFGRSLRKYLLAAQRIGLLEIPKSIPLLSRRQELDKMMRQINREGQEKYLIVCTGHQGEQRAVLSRIARGELALKLNSKTMCVFSCSVIPVELNIQNREKLERTLRSSGVRIFRDVHASGHASREDHRELIQMLKPTHIVPSHAGFGLAHHLRDLAVEMGYVDQKTVHMMEDGKRLVLE